MNEHLQKAISALKEKFGCDEHLYRNEYTLFVQAKDIVEAGRILRDEFGFDFLASLTAVDYWPEAETRMHVVYQFHSIGQKVHLRVRVPLSGQALSVPTLTGLYPNANWHEREIYDMFGVHFEGHPDMRRILMPFEWEGHPLRKDYPLGYEEPQFTFNFDEIDLRKPYVKE
jgi:NADH-quinone oxidoreductase subunit C